MGLDNYKASERAKRLRRIRERLHKIKSQRIEEAKRIKDATSGAGAVDALKKLKSNDDP